jgi:hypothetical protein
VQDAASGGQSPSRGERRDHDHGDVRQPRGSLHRLEDLPSAHARHHEIEHDQRGQGTLFERQERPLAILGQGDVESVCAQDAGQGRAFRFVVVHHEHAAFRGSIAHRIA